MGLTCGTGDSLDEIKNVKPTISDAKPDEKPDEQPDEQSYEQTSDQPTADQKGDVDSVIENIYKEYFNYDDENNPQDVIDSDLQKVR